MASSPSDEHLSLEIIHYGAPVLIFLCFGIALTTTACTLQTSSLKIEDQKPRRNVLMGSILAVVGLYLVELVTLTVQITLDYLPELGQDRVIYLLASAITFSLEAIALSDTKFPVWYPYYITWFLGMVVELSLIIVQSVFHQPATISDILYVVIQGIRCMTFVTLPCLYFWLRNTGKQYDDGDAERQALLGKSLVSNSQGSEEEAGVKDYGTTDQSQDNSDDSSDAGSEDSWTAQDKKNMERIANRLKQDGNWFSYVKGFAVFLPYIWPFHNRRLQVRAVGVIFCLLSSNVINVLMPRQLGKVVDTLGVYLEYDPGNKNSEPGIWSSVILYTVLYFVSGNACIGWLKQWLWLPIEQYSYDAMSTASHAHIMSLSSDFHDSKTSSELNQAVGGGRNINELLDALCFQFVPMFIDLAVAFAYLSVIYGPFMGLILAVEVIAYMYTTTKLLTMRTDGRRDYIAKYRKEWIVANQSMDGWVTASLFNQIPHETERYSTAVKDHMESKRSYTLSTQVMWAIQAAIISLGMAAALLLGVWQVARHGKSVGHVTGLLFYWAQLTRPMTFFSGMFRSLSGSLQDAERLLELFQTKPSIKDDPDAKVLKLNRGMVEFKDVSFAYDRRKPTLKHVSFSIPAGQTVALVGETGGGKSTILKLIGRFYDVKGGSITIDGQDVRSVTLSSLRAKIGVVPQDPMLFNDTIMSNLRYARLTATDDEVYAACRAAAIHDKIMSFPDGYSSKVGDHGVKLSGGERQRVAIARAILKQPELILLDEATSAVDTETESLIQEGLKLLCKDRTTFVVAHRLSTVMRADHIVVVINGEIVEQGSHSDLLHIKGKYHALWSKQIHVKSTTGRSRSPKKKHEGDLFNDLDSTQKSTTLAKAVQASGHDEKACELEATEVQMAIEDDKFYRAEGEHKREVSDDDTEIADDETTILEDETQYLKD